MAKTGDPYTAVEDLKDQGLAAFAARESDDDSASLITSLGEICDRADKIQTVAIQVNSSLEDLH